MTEDAALNLRCCGPEGCGEARPSRPPSRMDAGNPQLRYCIGARCMAWRNGPAAFDGYCGLAGKP